MSPSSELLRVLVAVQALFVGALFLFLLLNRVFRNVVSERRRRWAERAERALRGWTAGEREGAELADVLRNAPLAAARQALEEVWPELLDEDRRRLRALAHESGWNRVLRRRSRSLLWWRRMDTAQVLAFVGTTEDVETLARLLEDRHMAVRVAATFSARDLSHPRLLAPLLRQCVRSDPARRRSLLDAVLSFGREAVPAVLDALAEPGASDPEEEAILLTVAGRVAEQVDAPDLLLEVLRRSGSEHREVRIQAVKALGSFSDDRAVDVLWDRLDDPAWEVRAQAAKGLGSLGAEEALDDLRRALADESWWVRLRAAVALRQLGRPGLAALESVEAEEDPYAHDMAVYVLRLEEAALTDYAA